MRNKDQEGQKGVFFLLLLPFLFDDFDAKRSAGRGSGENPRLALLSHPFRVFFLSSSSSFIFDCTSRISYKLHTHDFVVMCVFFSFPLSVHLYRLGWSVEKFQQRQRRKVMKEERMEPPTERLFPLNQQRNKLSSARPKKKCVHETPPLLLLFTKK